METSLFEDLSKTIDKTQLECLNVQNSQNVVKLLCESQIARIESDSDQQLLFNFGFISAVKIHHFIIKSDSADSQPKIIKIFVNKLGMDFTQAEHTEPDQTIELKQNQTNIDLKFVKFQNVQNLTLFIEDNFGSDTTQIDQLKFYGISTEKTNMKGLKKIEHDD